MLGQGGLGQPNLAALSAGAGGNLFPALFASETVVYVPVMVLLPNVPLQPLRFVDPDSIYPIAVAQEGISNLFPFPFIDPDSIPSVLVLYAVTPIGMFSDPDQFYAPTIQKFSSQGISPQLVVDPDTIRVPFVDLVLKILPIPVVPQTSKAFFPPTITAYPPDPKYDYPPLHVIDADYGFRRSTRLTKERRIIGRRGTAR